MRLTLTSADFQPDGKLPVVPSVVNTSVPVRFSLAHVSNFRLHRRTSVPEGIGAFGLIVNSSYKKS